MKRRKVFSADRRPPWRVTSALHVIHASALPEFPNMRRRRARAPWVAPTCAPLRTAVDAANELHAGHLGWLLGIIVASASTEHLHACATEARTRAAGHAAEAERGITSIASAHGLCATAYADIAERFHEMALRHDPAVLGISMRMYRAEWARAAALPTTGGTA